MKKCYKLFRVDKSGALHPLYILSKEVIPVGKWLDSECGPQANGDPNHVKGKMVLSMRSGWHVAGSKPEAPQITEKRDQMCWCEVEIDDTHDVNAEAQRNGLNKHGVINPVKACFRTVPKRSWYYYRTSAKQTEPWIIADRMKVTKVLSWDEVDQLVA